MADTAPFLGSRTQKAFVGAVIIQGAIILTMLAISLGLVEGNSSGTSSSRLKTLPCYFAVFALAEIFHISLSLDALRLRNIIQIFGILIFQGGLIIYGAIQVEETKTGLVTTPGLPCATHYATCSGPGSLWNLVEPFQIVIPVVLFVTWIILGYLTWQLYGEFGWFVFRVVGADPKLKAMFEYYQILIVLLKFDYFFFLGLTMQLLILVLTNDSAQYGLTIAAIPVVLILLVACGIAVKQEIKWLMTVSLVLLLAAQAYFIYKFTRLFASSTRHQYDSTRKTLGVFIVAAFLLVFATFWIALKCMLDFDHGLRGSKMSEPTIFTHHFRTDAEKATTPMSPLSPRPGPNGTAGANNERTSYFGGEPLAPRMSIE
ncbi:hypothetical protein DL93DRAFT_2070655 [Clavulina sp. PMI_390]|nr:hypothetical protein DL93DRAFT_2070655 [Clavulina sp. PMI_390]